MSAKKKYIKCFHKLCVWHFNHNSPYSAFLCIKPVISKDQACQRWLHLAELVPKNHSTFPDCLFKNLFYHPPSSPRSYTSAHHREAAPAPNLPTQQSPASAPLPFPIQSLLKTTLCSYIFKTKERDKNILHVFFFKKKSTLHTNSN